MLPCPDGYIEVPEAQRRLWLRLHPEEASALQLTDGQLHTDYAKASEHLDEAGNTLLAALAAEQFGLKGVIFKDGRGFAVDPWYWHRDGARVGTLTNSTMCTLGEAADEWRSWNGLPCFIEEAKFTAWLNLIYPPADRAGQQRARESNAFARSFWSYNMLLAWVYLRDSNEVEMAADTEVGLVELDLDLRMALKRGQSALLPEFENCADARKDIINKLGNKAIVCIGLENRIGDPKEVPARYWSNAEIYTHVGNKRVVPYAGPTEPLRAGATTWHGLSFERDLALVAWPPLLTSQPNAAITATPDNDGASATLAASPLSRRLHKKTRLKVAAILPIVRRMLEHGQMGANQESICNTIRALAKRNSDLTFPKKRQGMWPIVKLAQEQAEAEIRKEIATKPGIVAQQKMP